MVRVVGSLLNIIIIIRASRLDVDMFKQNVCMSSKKPSGVIPVFVRSIAECASTCGIDPDCTGIYYSGTNKTCVLTSTTAFTVFDDDVDVIFYDKLSSGGLLSMTYSTSPTIVTEFTYPSTFIEHVFLIGRSSGIYTLKFSQQLKGADDAEQDCSCHGMQLFRVTSAVKVDDVSRFISSCSAYHGFDYWTDAKRHVTGPGTGPWENFDGDIIPDGAWCNGNPGTDSDEDCARLRSHCSYKLSDMFCNSTYGFICE